MIDTREYIIDKAYRLFLRHSYEAVSISTISNDIGLTKGALYHHFKNKEELFMAVIDKHFDFIKNSIKVDVDTITLEEYTEVCSKQSMDILQSVLKEKKDYLPINVLSLIADSFRHYKGFAERMMEFVDKETKEVERIIKNAIKRKEIRADIDIHIVALQFFSITLGMAGDIMRTNSIESAINSMKAQLKQLYQLLKI